MISSIRTETETTISQPEHQDKKKNVKTVKITPGLEVIQACEVVPSKPRSLRKREIKHLTASEELHKQDQLSTQEREKLTLKEYPNPLISSSLSSVKEKKNEANPLPVLSLSKIDKKEAESTTKKTSRKKTTREVFQDSVSINAPLFSIKEGSTNPFITSPSSKDLKKHKIERVKSSSKQKKKTPFEKKEKEKKIFSDTLQNPVSDSHSLPSLRERKSFSTSSLTPVSRKLEKHKIEDLAPEKSSKKGHSKKKQREKHSIPSSQEHTLEDLFSSDSHGKKKNHTKTLDSTSRLLKEDKMNHANLMLDEQISSQQLKKLLINCHSLNHLQIKNMLLLLIKVKSAYPILHELCKKHQTEEHIEFLFDYIHMSQIDQQIKPKAYHKALKAIVKKYLLADSDKLINIEGRLGKEIVQLFKNQNFTGFDILINQVKNAVLLLLWNNVFFDAFADFDTTLKILETI